MTRSRTRSHTEQSATGSEQENGDAQAKPRCRTNQTKSAQSEEAEGRPATRRSTRARSRSADSESDVDAELPGGKAQKKAASGVQTIPEDEELNLPESGPAPARKPTVAAGRARRTRSETESSMDDSANSNPRRRTPASSDDTGPTKRPTRSGAASDSTGVDDAANRENKENTPEHSPTSESGYANTEGKKPATKARTPATRQGSRAQAIQSKLPTFAASSTKKPPSRTVKSKASSDESVAAPRTTRARAKK
jgi:hypothetical protein